MLINTKYDKAGKTPGMYNVFINIKHQSHNLRSDLMSFKKKIQNLKMKKRQKNAYGTQTNIVFL